MILLGKAILKSQGRTWDGMPILKLKVTDLRREAVDLLKEKAIRRGRLTEEETRIDDIILYVISRFGERVARMYSETKNKSEQ